MKPGPARVAVIIAAVATLTLAAQQQAPVFRGGVSVVPITVSVVDRKGNSVEGLQAKDFRIFEGDRPREIVAFYPQVLEPGAALPPQGTVTSGERDRLVRVRADAATHAEWLKAGLKRTLHVPVTAAPTFVKVVVYDAGSDRAGSASTRIK